jgi:hypothetical protein
MGADLVWQLCGGFRTLAANDPLWYDIAAALT